MTKTFMAKPADIVHNWLVVDAAGLVLGDLASQIAIKLRGKHKPIYTPHADTGDYVIVINADKIVLTGNKDKQKIYFRHSEYPGGIKQNTFKEMISTYPERILQTAVKGMMPKGPLGREMLRKLKVYAGTNHPHEAQQPQVWAFS